MNFRERFKEALGRTSFRVVHQVGGKEVDENEVLRGATEHATVYPCEIREDPNTLLEKVLQCFDSVGRVILVDDKEGEVPWDEPRPPSPPLSGSAPPPAGGDQERYPPNDDDLGTRGKAELLAIGVDVSKDPDHFVVTVICPCGSRASIASRTMSVRELAFVYDWTTSHERHLKGEGH